MKIFFDGECGLCHYFVFFILKHMKKGASLRFGIQRSSDYNALLKRYPELNNMDAIVVVRGGKVSYKSRGVIEVARALKFPYCVVGWVMRLVPRAWGDLLYDRVAKKRQSIAKRYGLKCRMIPQEWAHLFDHLSKKE